MPFSVHPPVAGEGRWLTKQSFVFAADEDYRPGKKYSLLFREDLRAMDGRPTRMYYSFTNAAPEVRKDRLLLFFDMLDGTISYIYSLRPVSSGTFALPPLAAEAMYAPENRAVTPGGEAVIE